MTSADIERFKKFCKPAENGCIEWIGNRPGGRYGQFTLNGKPRKAHRVAWEMANGKIPVGLLVCHRCDNMACVNVEHLFVGTAADNMRNMVAKGRGAEHIGVRGAGNHRAKLTDAQAQYAYDTGGKKTAKAVAAELGVSPMLVIKIRNGKLWTHVTGGVRKEVHVLSDDDVSYVRRNPDAMTQSELARKLGVPRSYVLLIMQGKRR